MDGQELYNLYEAYMEVVENQQENVSEMFGFGRKKGKSPLADALMNSDYMKKKNKEADEKAIQNLKDMLSKDPERQKRPSKINNEEVDIYDIILSHLLDEGYAETLEAAEVMMVNMSEEWRYSIMEEVLDEERKSLPITKMKEKEDQLKNELQKRGRGRAKIGIRLDTIQNIRRNISKRGGKEDLSAVFNP